MSSLRLWSASERERKGYLKRHPAFYCKRDGKLARGQLRGDPVGDLVAS